MTENRSGALLRAILFVLAAALLITAYYWVHKPFDAISVRRYAGIAVDLLAPALLVLIGCGVGRAVWMAFAHRAALVSPFTRAETLALSGGIGLALLGFVGLALGLAGLYNRIAFLVALAILAVLFRRGLRDTARDAVDIVRSIRFESPFVSFLIVFSGAMLLLALITSIAPPTSWDAMVYHLVEPQRDLALGRMSGSPENFYLGFPKAIETLFGIVMGVTGRDSSTAPVHFWTGILALLAAGGLARRLAGSTRAAWVTVALLIGSFNVWQLYGWQYVDLAIMLYGALMFSVLLAWDASRQIGWVVLLGALGGAAFGVKYTAGALLLAAACVLLARHPRRFLPNLIALGLSAGVWYAPWALRGILLYGNPIYPYLFGGLDWDASRMAAFSQSGRGLISTGQAWEVAALPFMATIMGFDYGPTYSFTLGPFLLTAPFLALLVWRWLAPVARTAFVIGVLVLVPIYAYWAITALFTGIGMQTRLVIAMLPVSAVLGALAIDALDRLGEKPVNLGFLARALLVLTLSFGSLTVLSKVVDVRAVSAVMGGTSRDDLLFQNLASHPATLARLGALPAGSDVQFLWEPRSYYCPPTVTCRPDVLFDRWNRQRRAGLSAEDIFAAWRASGIDYFLFFRTGFQAYPDFANAAAFDQEFPAAVQAHLREVWTTPDGRYTLYTWPDA